jgi:heat shock protein HtpX
MNRVLLFLATNFAVVFVLSVVLHLLGVDQQGQNLLPLIVVTSIFGMGGAFVSLWLSKSMSLRATGARLIEQPASPAERWLVETVRRHATKAGIGMPDVAVFDSPTPNAFATGADRDHALVAVSTGLLQNMGESEVEAVLGHEISHVANGDMVTLTLIQGVVNTFVMVFARLVAAVIDRGGRGGDYRGGGIGYFAAYMVAQAVLGFLASMIVMWFSRHREFRADAGGAALAGRPAMIAALERLQQVERPSDLPPAMAAFGITGGLPGMLGALLASHPPLEARIAALRAGSRE